MKTFFFILAAVIPAISMAQSNNNERIVINYNPNAADDEGLFDEYYPEPSAVRVVEEPKKSGNGDGKWEIVLSGGINESVGNLHETNAQLHTTALFRFHPDWAVGLATGYYHSMGPFYSRHIAMLGVVNYTFNCLPVWDFTPFVEAYGGSLLGVYVSDRIDDDSDAPNCPIFGLKAGLSYNLYDLSKFYPSLAGKHWLKKVRLYGSLNYMHVGDNSSETYEKTSENCFGAMGGIGFRF